MPNEQPRRVGRPKGPPHTVVNLRISLDLLRRLDRYVDRARQFSPADVNRATVMREALQMFLESKGL